MSEPSETLSGSTWDVEQLLTDALRPIEPPERLSGRLEDTLAAVTQAAAEELSDWAEELSESELRALRDPRNWVRPVVAVGAGGVATGALVLLELRRRGRNRSERGLRSLAERASLAALASAVPLSTGGDFAPRSSGGGRQPEQADDEVERAVSPSRRSPAACRGARRPASRCGRRPPRPAARWRRWRCRGG